MILPERLDEALDRLTGALHRLQAAAAPRLAAGGAALDAAEEQADRARLAGDLVKALQRAESLLAANTEVAARLAHAGATIDAVMAALAGDAAAEPESG